MQTGDRVFAGHTLMVIDSRAPEANLRRAQAGQAEAQNAIAETENTIVAARANLELARVTHKHLQDLLAKKSVTHVSSEEAPASKSRLGMGQGGGDVYSAWPGVQNSDPVGDSAGV